MRRLAFAVLGTFVLAHGVQADSPVTTLLADTSVSTDEIDAAIGSIEAQPALDDETRESVVGELRSARELVIQKLAADEAAEEFRDSISTAPEQTERLVASLESTETRPATLENLGIRDDTPLNRLESLLAAAIADRAALEAELADIEARILAQSERPDSIRRRLAELRTVADELNALLGADAPPGESSALTEARTLTNKTRLAARTAEFDQLEQEQLSHEPRLKLLHARRDLGVRKSASLAERVELVQSLVDSRRQTAAMQAQRAAAEAQLAVADDHPAVLAIAEQNARLAGDLPDVAQSTRETGDKVRLTERTARRIESELLRSRQRLDVGGVTQAIGGLLLTERRNLPSVSRIHNASRQVRREVSRVGLERLWIEDERLEVSDLEASVENAMLEVAEDVGDADRQAAIRVEIRRLLENRRQLLGDAASTYSTYLRSLGDLDVAQQRLLQSTLEFRDFLGRNLLWIPSTTSLGWNTFRQLDDAFVWAVSAESWGEIGTILRQYLALHGSEALAALVLIALLLASLRPLLRIQASLNSRVGRLSTDHIGLTLGSIAIDVARVFPLPLLLALLGFALQRAPSPTDFSAALGTTLLVVAPFLFCLLLVLIIVHGDGVGRKHFGWHEGHLAIVRKQLRRLLMLGLPVVFVTTLAYDSPVASHRDSLGRLGFIVFMALLLFIVRPIVNPKGPVAASFYARYRDRWIGRSARVLYAVEMGAPIALALLAAAGFLYTAVTLTGFVINTIWLILGLALANLIALRWLALTRRKIAWQLALDKRAARLAEQESEESSEGEGEIPVVEPETLDLDAVDQQTRRLLRAGLLFVGVLIGWGIWSEVLPALKILEDVSLWSRMAKIGGVETTVPVTLADVFLALIVAGVTLIASRNLPGLMEIAILQRLDLEHGSRYTINTLLRYAVITIGVISILGIVGWNWSRIQWLVAALSVGLGFGLQEIVGNFISGLIILFERPVRVGDTVTVGQLTGTVTKVQIRATTITDWDRKEIIVPNKSFITEQVVNWTLSDPITRIVISVGISYGSDVKLATKVMQDTLHATPLVLDEPAPRVFFTGFGDSSLNFRIFVYLKDLGDRMPLTHMVHERILAALRDAGITIPFPQRDLHIHDTKGDAAD